MKRLNIPASLLIVLALAACSSVPSGSPPKDNGVGRNLPAHPEAVPDAVPRVEPLVPSANRSYTVLGKTYYPIKDIGQYKERGIASWYGKPFHGRHTTSGQIYNMYTMTAAHPTLPIPSYARVTHLSNHKSVVVRINDRGPFAQDRIIDLSYAAANKLGLVSKGVGEVEVESLTPGVAMPPAAPIADASVSAAPVSRAPASASQGVYLQLGAFKSQQNAENFLAQMRAQHDFDGKSLSLNRKDALVRVHLGPYASSHEARATAAKLEASLGFRPVVSSR